MGFVHSWEVLTVLRAFLGVFEAGRKYSRSNWELKLIRCSLSRRCIHHRVLVSTVRDSEASVDLLHGGVVGLRFRTDRESRSPSTRVR